MSQADATSLEGEEQPAITGCYRQFEHGMPDKLPATDPDQVRQLAAFAAHFDNPQVQILNFRQPLKYVLKRQTSLNTSAKVQ